LKIVEPERRQWSAFNFVGFWIADSFNINTWMIAASSLDVGLSWWQAWICVWYGSISEETVVLDLTSVPGSATLSQHSSSA
jgi:cytosine/uracil/thiamine/allantoin permease